MKSGEFTITKRFIELYVIRHSSSSYWADISIDDNGSGGRLKISSDYGNWEYYWGACGTSLKEFIKNLDIGYAANKFGEGNYFLFDDTIKFYNFSIVNTTKGVKFANELLENDEIVFTMI